MLFTGMLYCREECYQRGVERLKGLFGPVIKETLPVSWHSDYYAEELGPGIIRRFVFFGDLIDQDEIRGIKLRTVELESELSRDGRREVNIDPGYLTQAKVVLASTKDYSHRIYLGSGIFAETTLYYQDGGFNPHLFTYRDFSEEKTLEMFREMRRMFQDKLESG